MSASSSSESPYDSEDEFTGEPQEVSKTKLKFFTSDEIIIHNTTDDLWALVNRVAFNLTPILTRPCYEDLNPVEKYLVAFGGKDLSCYFDESGKPQTILSGVTGHAVPKFAPAILKSNESGSKYWWEDSDLQIGRLTREERPIRVINTLTGKVYNMIVCDEDTIYHIQAKYRDLYNHHAGSYIWRKDYKNGTVSGRLFLNKTLTENGLFPLKNGIGPSPALWLFYGDDLTIA